jgi:hypothetical protein
MNNMKDIYLTEQGKQEIEAKIAELEKFFSDDERKEGFKLGRLKELNKILSSATILPVETNGSYVRSHHFCDEFDVEYPNGVIIQPKK